MDFQTQQERYPTTIFTPRLRLRLSNPDSIVDSEKIISIYQDRCAGMGGNARVGINTLADVQQKYSVHGPRASLCTRVPASATPRSLFFLITLLETDELIGYVGCSFRREMPYPDLGYALFSTFWGHGYASEAGRETVRWWRDVIGVREMWLALADQNTRSRKTAERIGFVKAGSVDVCFGSEEQGGLTKVEGTAYVWPGTKWREYDEMGRKTAIYPTIGTETEEQKTGEIKFG